MSRRKVCVVVNSRANYGRIKSFMVAAQKHQGLDLQLIVGASALLYRFGSAIDVMRRDGFEPNAIILLGCRTLVANSEMVSKPAHGSRPRPDLQLLGPFPQRRDLLIRPS